jgi:hypothetical protein
MGEAVELRADLTDLTDNEFLITAASVRANFSLCLLMKYAICHISREI